MMKKICTSLLFLTLFSCSYPESESPNHLAGSSREERLNDNNIGLVSPEEDSPNFYCTLHLGEYLDIKPPLHIFYNDEFWTCKPWIYSEWKWLNEREVDNVELVAQYVENYFPFEPLKYPTESDIPFPNIFPEDPYDRNHNKIRAEVFKFKAIKKGKSVICLENRLKSPVPEGSILEEEIKPFIRVKYYVEVL